VLEHVRGEADVHGAVGYRQPHAVAAHCVMWRSAAACELRGLRFDQDAARAARQESRGEMAGAAADVDDGPAGQTDVVRYLADGVGGQLAVEALGL
jgi:hypothetical protein